MPIIGVVEVAEFTVSVLVSVGELVAARALLFEVTLSLLLPRPRMPVMFCSGTWAPMPWTGTWLLQALIGSWFC